MNREASQPWISVHSSEAGFASFAEGHIQVIEGFFVGLFSLVDHECEATGFDAPFSGERRPRAFSGQDGIWNECNTPFFAE